MDKDRLELLMQVATWYYEENQEQSVIAKRIGKSRSMVSRLLQEARDQGLVEIRVRHPLQTDPELESQLVQTFGLSRAWVLADPPNNYTLLLRSLGKLGARCLQQKLHDNIKIGIGWGASLHQLVRAMPHIPLKQAMVIQITGAVGHSDPMVDGTELSRWLAQKLRADHRSLPAPLIVENETIAQSLLQDRTVTETLSLTHQAEVTLIGIGTIDFSLSGLYRTGHFNRDDVVSFKKAGVVGDLVGHLIDVNGNPVNLPFNRCIIGQDLEALRAVPTVIAIAGGIHKASAILATLRCGCINVLVTDAFTASNILTLYKK